MTVAAPVVLAAPDKFRGTATAAQVGDAIADAAAETGWTADRAAISDGGEGFVACFGGANRSATVAGPLGDPVDAGWRLAGDVAVLEAAAACGLALVGARVDPVGASTRGVGQLIAAAARAGATRVLLGVGGSATTDGGAGALPELAGLTPLDGARGVEVTVACDVRTRFLDAATTFAPQKGADATQVAKLSARLAGLADRYAADFGFDVRPLVGAGAAGGLAGGLAAVGATLRPGFELVAEELRLAERIAAARLVITGEGRFDATSSAGKGPGALMELCRAAGVPVVLVVGAATATPPPGVTLIDLSQRYGPDAARSATTQCVRRAVADTLGNTG